MKKLIVPLLYAGAGSACCWFFVKRPDAGPGRPVAEGTAALAAATEAHSGMSPLRKNSEGGLEACREILRTERNPGRAAVKMMAMLDTMDAASITALAGQLETLAGSPHEGMADMVIALVFGKLAELDPGAAWQTALNVKSVTSRTSAAGAVMEQLAITNPDAAVAALEKMPRGYVRQQVLGSLATALAAKDGPAAVALLERAGIPAGNRLWNEMAGAWASRDPAGAAARLLTLPQRTTLCCMDAVMSEWTRSDPGTAAKWAAALTDPAQRKSAVSSVIRQVSLSDPRRALSMAAEQPPANRRQLMKTIAAAFADAEGPEAVKWAQSLSDPLERQRCLVAITERGGICGLETAKAAMELLPPGSQRNYALRLLASDFADSDLFAARDWALTLKPEEQAQVMPQMITRMAESDPAAAEKLTASLPATEQMEWAWRSIAKGKATLDPAAALTWAAGIESERDRATATGEVTTSWALHSPAEAATAIAAISDSSVSRQASASLARIWAVSDAVSATHWAETLTGEERLTALSLIWHASAADDPQTAGKSLAAVAAANGAGAAGNDQLVDSAGAIASAWTERSPAEAAAWALSLTEGKVREQAVAKVADEWASHNPVEASEWITGLPHDPSRDAAVSKLVQRIASSDPERAFTWATSMDNPEGQIRVLKSVLSKWREVNPGAAETALRNANLPGEVSKQLQEALH